jgi:hypothetical protein
MAADATTAYIAARTESKDVAILCDTWEIADAINQRLHDHLTDPDAASVLSGYFGGDRTRDDDRGVGLAVTAYDDVDDDVVGRAQRVFTVPAFGIQLGGSPGT